MIHIIRNQETGNVREFEDASEAKKQYQELQELAENPENVVLEESGGSQTTQNAPEAVAVEGKESPSEVVEASENGVTLPERIQNDPLDRVPEHFVDIIQGTPAINKKGYAVLCEHFDVEVTAEPITLASDTEFEYAEFTATAVTADGKEYSGYGSAHVDRGDESYLLNEKAETRAMKRSAGWATGIGIVGTTEMEGVE